VYATHEPVSQSYIQKSFKKSPFVDFARPPKMNICESSVTTALCPLLPGGPGTPRNPKSPTGVCLANAFPARAPLGVSSAHVRAITITIARDAL
jgi:hypothetical protein